MSDNIKIENSKVGKGIILKNFLGEKDNIEKAIKKVLGDDKEVFFEYKTVGSSGGEYVTFDRFLEGYFIPLSDNDFIEKNINDDNLDKIYSKICKNIEIRLDKNDYGDYEKFILDLPKEATFEDFDEAFQNFIKNASEEDKEHEDELYDYSIETFRSIKKLKEIYNVVTPNSITKEEKSYFDNVLEYSENMSKVLILGSNEDGILAEVLDIDNNKFTFNNFVAENILEKKNVGISDVLESEILKKEINKVIERVTDELKTNFSLSNEEIIEGLDLKYALPKFEVNITDDVRYNSKSDMLEFKYINNKGEEFWQNEYQDISDDWNYNNSIEVVIGNRIKNIKGQEYWDNMDISNIKDWEEINNTGFVKITYNSGTEYTNYDDYTKETIDEELKEIFKENIKDVIKEVKELVKKDNKQDNKQEYIIIDEFEKLESKYNLKIESLEEKLNNAEVKKDNKDFKEEKLKSKDEIEFN